MRIVVGVGDVGVSDIGAEHPAIDWAVQLSTKRATTVELVHVVDVTWGHAPEMYVEEALLVAEGQLRDRARAAQERNPDIVVESHVRIGSPVNELVSAARGADFLVIGAQRSDTGNGAGRRAVRIARLAPCSVIVAPRAGTPAGSGVVVGVDGSAESALAVEFAADLAARVNESLTVVLSAGRFEAWGVIEPDMTQAQPSEDDRLLIAESIAGVAARYPDLVVKTEVSASRPERALTSAAEGARMLVVGSHGRHTIARALLGSTSEAVVADLPCAVAVIRAASVAQEEPSSSPVPDRDSEKREDHGTQSRKV